LDRGHRLAGELRERAIDAGVTSKARGYYSRELGELGGDREK
jgi:hypothetical protein